MGNMLRLFVAEDGHHLETEDGKAFIYLADTAWTIGNKLSIQDVDYYLKNRKEKGFTVIQVVLLDPETEHEMKAANGELALSDRNPLLIRAEYWAYLDEILQMAEKLGFYILLLPVWGQLVTGDDWSGNSYPKLVDEGNAFEFGRIVGSHYAEWTNLIWCLGGDRHPVHQGTDYRMVWRRMAEGLAYGTLGLDLHWNEKDDNWNKILITYHPTYSDDPPVFSSSFYFPDEPWLSFHMLQSGHRDCVRNYDQICQDYNRMPKKPVLDGESNYEDWFFPTAGGFQCHDDWNVRKRAYWSLFAGACGHTYGNACVWRMVKPNEKTEYLRFDWKEALDQPGAFQMKYLKRLMEREQFFKSRPCQEMIGHLDNYLDIRKEVRLGDDGSFAYIYFTSGGGECVDLSRLKGTWVQYSWYNPRNGQEVGISRIKNQRKRARFEAPTCGVGEDWVLILEASPGVCE